MNKIAVVILAAFSASIVLAEDFKTIDGKEYKNATVSRIEPDGIVLTTKTGISKVYFAELPKDVQERFHYVDPAEAEAERAAALAKREQDVEAILKESEAQFETLEMRAMHTYKAKEKGTLFGQIFIATRGGENVKLGAIQVSLFARDAIDALLGGLYEFVAVKSQRLRLDIASAAAAEEQAKIRAEQDEATAKRNQEPNKGSAYSDGETAIRVAREAADTARKTERAARTQVESLSAKQAYYHSYPFYFSYLRLPIEVAETNGDGRFMMQVPREGEFVITAQAARSLWKDTERYYWLQPVSLEGQDQRIQNLSK